MVIRLYCVFDRVTQRHLYRIFELQVINIYALDVKRPEDSFRQLARRSSSFYLMLYSDFCGIKLIEIVSLKKKSNFKILYFNFILGLN